MRMKWDETGARLYETGTDHVVLFPYDTAAAKYGTGVPWNGVTGVTESPSGAEPTALWADNIKYLNLYSAEEFGATITAYTYPDEFADLDGSAEVTPGVRIGQQSRGMFALAYRTKIGNDTQNTKHGYKIHLIYGAMASPSEKGYSSINDSPEAIEFSWELTTTPVDVDGFEPTASLTIDSTKVDAEKLAAFEDILYGSNEADARIPLPDEVALLLGNSNPLAALMIDSTIGATVDLFGKNVGDLQTGVAVGANAITGTLKYVTGYTGFSSDTSLQSGNYLAIHAEVPEVSDVTIVAKVTNPVIMDADGIAVLRIADKNTQTVTITASKDGYDTVTKVFSLTGLTCLAA